MRSSAAIRAFAFGTTPARTTGAFAEIDIVISSTAAPDYVLDRARLEPLLKRRQQRPLLLIDLAVPRDIDPEVNFMENVYLYNVDDLQGIANKYLEQRREEIAKCEVIIAEKAGALLQHAPSPHVAPPAKPAPAHG